MRPSAALMHLQWTWGRLACDRGAAIWHHLLLLLRRVCSHLSKWGSWCLVLAPSSRHQAKPRENTACLPGASILPRELPGATYFSKKIQTYTGEKCRTKKSFQHNTQALSKFQPCCRAPGIQALAFTFSGIWVEKLEKLQLSC